MRQWVSATPLVLISLAANADSVPQPSVQTLTREQALSLPPTDLARIALQSVARKYVEVARPTFSGMAGPNAALAGLEFATVPESAGNPGLCKATVLSVYFDPISDQKVYDRKTPVEASSVSTETVFKVVGDTSPLPDDWNDKYDLFLRQKCAEAGRVLPAETANLGEVGFFHLKEGRENDSWLAARALQLAITNTFSADTKINCVDSIPKRSPPKECKDTLALLRSLKLLDLTEVNFKPCPNQLDRFCIDGEFLRSAFGNARLYWEVSIQAQVRDPEYSSHDITHVDAITIGEGGSIYD